MDVPINVEVNPNEDTEWNDILRKHGIIPEKPPSPTPRIQEALIEAEHLAHERRLEGKTIEELDELEDEEDEDFLASYRAQRFNELGTIARASVFGHVYALQKPEYAREVTETSAKAWVLVLLTAAGANPESSVAEQLWRELAARFGDVKFCQMRADLCIEGYPERNTPTVLVYRDGDIRRQLVTLREMQGPKTTVADFEQFLVELGAVKDSDARLQRKNFNDGVANTNGRSLRAGGKTNTAQNEDDDSDWD